MSESRDHFLELPGGTAIVRHEDGRLTMVTWLPERQDDPAYPGFTITEASFGLPPTSGVAAVTSWVILGDPNQVAYSSRQLPAARDASAVQRPTAFEHGRVLGYTKEPDGSYSYGIYSREGELLGSGMAENWDDARLAMIESWYPASGEA